MPTLLFDLDDTLLGNRIERFLPAYFTLIAEYAAAQGFTGDFTRDLIASTQSVIADTDPATSNFDVLLRALSARVGRSRAELMSFLDRYYADVYPALRDRVTFATAPRLVQHCLDRGWPVIVATNPLFPTHAIEQRLTWAGLPPSAFPFTLVTTMDNMHATKPSLAYYREIFAQTGLAAADAIMVGDSWTNDIEPAAALGMTAFYIGVDPPEPSLIAGSGTLADCLAWLESL